MRRPLLFLAAAALPLLTLSPATPAAQPPDLTVMSFNIRTGNADQGTVNAWDTRKPIVAQTIRDFGPDLFGLQEALRYQWKYLEDQFPGYQEVGKSVNDDGTSEYVALFYKKSRFTEIAKGNFWLNPTNTPGVLGWDAKFVRMATWVELQDNQNPSLTFLYMNTHWDNVGDTARLHSADIMRSMIEQLAPGLPVIVSGDFNADQGGAAYRRMTGLDNADPFRDYHDTYRQIHPEDAATVGTSLGFDGVGNNDGRIDWILQDGFTTLDATIDRASYNGHFPSDHFPITATLRALPEPTALTLLCTFAATPLLSRRPRRQPPAH
jgi:endonuclease/exonuclease/phosphatase family metal-dependent hydrolase